MVPGSAAGQRLSYELDVLASCLWLSLSGPSEEQDARRSRFAGFALSVLSAAPETETRPGPAPCRTD